MCGLFGFSGDPKIWDKNIAKAVQAKVKILGLYNIERGKHSCGIFIDSDMYKGVKEDKLFSDFIQNNQLPLPGEYSGNHVIIGHTRQATTGEHTIENAHPFLINDSFVLAHNGTLNNVWGLCNKYNIDHTGIKVDSLALGHLIHKLGFKVLSEYKGFAALLMHKLDEPNSLYIYRGVSKRWSGGAEEEERPLYYMKTEEGIYISSLEKSLLSISDGTGDEVKIVEGNIVHKITNGKMTKSKYVVNREDVNYGVNVSNCTTGSCTTNFPKTSGTGTNATKNTGINNSGGTNASSTTNSSVGKSTPASSSHDVAKVIPIIFHETLPSRIDKYKGVNGVFFHMGRYWILEGEEIKLAHGEYYINKKGVVKDHKTKDNHNHYFYEGVLMRNEKCWNAACEDNMLKDSQINFAMTVSLYSEYPVCNSRPDITTRCRSVNDYAKYRWYHNQKMCGNTGFTPKWSDRNYTLRDGLSHSIAAQGNLLSKETCIDGKSLSAERQAAGLEETRHLAPVVVMPKSEDTVRVALERMKQVNIPFQQVPEFDVSNFYRPYDSVEEARNTLTMEEINAIRYYVCDVMMLEMSIQPDTIYEDTVEVQLAMFLQQTIDNRATLAESWDEFNYEDIPHYLEVARENPEGKVWDEPRNAKKTEVGFMQETGEVNEACTFVPKPTVDAQTTLSNTTVELDTYVEVLDEDEAPVDKTVEAAHVPGNDEEEGLKVERVGRDEEKEFIMEDIADFLGDVRDCADEFQRFDDDDFCQDAANAIYKSVEPLLYKLRDLAQQYGKETMYEHLFKTIEQRVSI